MKSRTFLLLTLSLISSVLVSAIALAQNYEAMIQQQLQQGQNMAAQMQQMQQGIVQQNMQNPQVQAMYQQHLAAGGQLSFDQFAYNYAATGGFTQEGMARYRQSEQANQQKEAAAMQAYRDAQAQRGQAMQEMHNQNNEMAHDRGNLLNGTTDYRDPTTGAIYNLPHTAQPNEYYRDPNSGNGFYNDQQGNFYRQDPDGYEYELEEDD